MFCHTLNQIYFHIKLNWDVIKLLKDESKSICDRVHFGKTFSKTTKQRIYIFLNTAILYLQYSEVGKARERSSWYCSQLIV